MRPSQISIVLYLAFAVIASLICYRRPVQGDYDRYVYEVVVRSWTQSWVDFYPTVKNESEMLQKSPGFDSAEHMAQREPIFAIRPIYLALIAMLHNARFGYQSAISLISSASFFIVAVLFLVWTKRPVLSALVISSPLAVQIARQGVPDGLNAVSILSALWCIFALKRTTWGIVLLMISVWIRTDSLLVCTAVLLWLTYEKKLEFKYCAALIAIACSSVEAINYFSGNYGYAVLFRATFIGGIHPALISNAPITAREYLAGLSHNVPSIVPELAPWCLLAGVAWQLRSPLRNCLIPVGTAALLHFLLFPSAEIRYLNWACLLAGIAFVQGVPQLRAMDQRLVLGRMNLRTPSPLLRA